MENDDSGFIQLYLVYPAYPAYKAYPAYLAISSLSSYIQLKLPILDD